MTSADASRETEQARRLCEALTGELEARLVQAEAVLATLEEAKLETERHLEGANRVDAVKSVTGRSAFEAAIESTRAMIDRIRGALADAKRLLRTGEGLTMDAAAGLRAAVAVAG